MLLLYLSLSPAPPQIEGPLGWDKLLHAAALGGTAFLSAGICLVFRKSLFFSLVTGFISASLFGALIELLQWSFTVNRQAELLDLAADMIGAFFAMAILYLTSLLQNIVRKPGYKAQVEEKARRTDLR